MHSIWQYIKYFFKSKHWRGYGVHSPYMFYLVTMIIEDRNSFYRFSQIENMRKVLKNTTKTLMVGNEGEKKEVKISSLLKQGSISPSYDQLLFRLSRYFHPKNILEIGTTIGLSTMYMAAPDSTCNVYTVEKDAGISSLARLNFKRAEFSNIKVLNENVSSPVVTDLIKTNQIDLYYFGRKASDEDVRCVLECTTNRYSSSTVIMISDIYKTKEREILWNEMKQIKGVRVCLELFFYGILIFNEDLQPQSYNLFYIPTLFR